MKEVYVVVCDNGYDRAEVVGVYATPKLAIGCIAEEISGDCDRNDSEIWEKYVDELVEAAELRKMAPTFADWLEKYMKISDADNIENYYIRQSYLEE